ncbi:MAG TPA: hypothetical protein VFG68_11920 [Fimbriiglobus sp.]|nr:hypothetical protein [Fimbriiglobus sp.]
MAASPRRPKPSRTAGVFVNCPFDDQYKPLFRALVFTIQYCGFDVRCALEVDDSGETRAEKLIRLIRDAKLGIHDISRTEANAEELPRFNMPYELGLFVGFKHSSDPSQRKKSILILDRERYRYQKFLSDIAGQDIRSHGADPKTLIREVRNWLRNQTARELEGGEHIIEQFRLFCDQIPQLLSAMNKTERDLENYLDFHQLVFNWIRENVVRG